MSPIDAGEVQVPSWSWMGLVGEIEYSRLAFDQNRWEAIQAPWTGLVEDDGWTVGQRGLELLGDIRTVAEDAADCATGKLYFDMLGERVGEMRCVVLGVEKGRVLSELRHYFILVEPVGGFAHVGEVGLYERVGAGYLPGKYISAKREKGRIC